MTILLVLLILPLLLLLKITISFNTKKLTRISTILNNHINDDYILSNSNNNDFDNDNFIPLTKLLLENDEDLSVYY